jgi:hypothetical protein
MGWMDDAYEEMQEMKRKAKKELDYESLLDSEENDSIEHDDAGREE